MRGLSLLLILISLILFQGCVGAPDLPEIPVTLNLTKNYQSLQSGDHELILSMETKDQLRFSLTDHGVEILSFLEGQVSVLAAMETIHEWDFTISGATSDGYYFSGKAVDTSAGGYVCAAPVGGHHSCRDGRTYSFTGDLRLGGPDGEVIGTFNGKTII
jgi:hypothetical protein